MTDEVREETNVERLLRELTGERSEEFFENLIKGCEMTCLGTWKAFDGDLGEADLNLKIRFTLMGLLLHAVAKSPPGIKEAIREVLVRNLREGRGGYA